VLSAGVILFLAALQGLTELFPVSSLGHAVVVPPLIGLNFRETSPAFVPVLAILHLGTATALLILYRRDWVRIISGFFRAAVNGRIGDPDQRLAIMLIIGTVPTGVIGFLLQDPLKSLFGNPRAASAFLIVNGESCSRRRCSGAGTNAVGRSARPRCSRMRRTIRPIRASRG
jgi:undecaprenyl-diphosphatase